MSYTVLARKYRPQVFADMVGQEHVVKVLTNAIASGRVAHAYLFSGPRGVGKTTAARILAKALNCEKGPTPEPCGVCSTCREIRDGRSMDVLEIDGASNRGINEVRELRENVRFAPSGGRFKVYIIDEVHMLTQEAFNALLKTLEEPPSQVIFVFATTEPFKVPATILSRCQRFDFARIPTRGITDHLAAVLARENEEIGQAGKPAIVASPAALSLIARRAQGGLRDALSLLDQVLAAVDGPLERESVEAFLGLVGEEFYQALVDRLAEGDAAGVLLLLDSTYGRGADLRDLSEGLAGYLRDLLLLRIGDELAPLLDAPPSEVPRLRAQAQRFSRETLIDLVDRAADLTPSLRRTESPRLTMELALAEMAETSLRIPLGEVAARLLEMERRLGGGPAESAKPAKHRVKDDASPPTRGPAARPDAAPGPSGASKPTSPDPAAHDPASAEGIWALCLEAALAKSIPLGSKLAQGSAVSLAPGGGLVLRPASPAVRSLLQDCLAEPGTQELLAGVLASHDLRGVRLQLESDSSVPPSAPSTPNAVPGAVSGTSAGKKSRLIRDSSVPGKTESVPKTPPAEQAGPEDKTAPAPQAPVAAEPDTRSVGQLFKEEPLLQKALDMFDGEVIP